MEVLESSKLQISRARFSQKGAKSEPGLFGHGLNIQYLLAKFSSTSIFTVFSTIEHIVQWLFFLLNSLDYIFLQNYQNLTL